MESHRMALRNAKTHDLHDPNLKAIHSLYFDRVVSMDCQIHFALGKELGTREMENFELLRNLKYCADGNVINPDPMIKGEVLN